VQAAILVGRGLAQLALSQTDEAQASLAEAQKLAPKSVDPLLAEERLALARKDTAVAEQKVDAALALDPHSAEALLRKSYLQAVKGDQKGAIASLDQAVAAAPSEYSARLARAGLLISAGQDDKARADVNAVLAVLPGSAQAIYFRAVLLARAQDYKAADADLEKLTNFIARYPGAYLIQAVVKQHLGQLEQALDAATHYAARTPADPRGAKLLAELNLQMKRPRDAVAALARLAKEGSQVAQVYDLLGRAYAASGNPALSAQSYQKAVSLAPDNADLLTRLGIMELALGNPGAASGDFEHSLKLAPAQPRTEEMLATAALAANNLDEATASLERLRKQQGNSEAVGNISGLIKLSRFDLSGARSDFEAVVHDHPDSIAARLNLARLANLQGNAEQSRQYLSDVLQRQPANRQALTALTAQLLRAGKTADAIAAMERAHAAAAGNPQITAELADLYIRSGDPKKALPLTESGPGQPVNPAVLTARADAQAALGQQEDARATFRQVLAAAPAALPVRLRLAGMLVQAKDYDGARAVLQEGLAADPQNYALLQALVGTSYQEGGLDAALARADVLAKDPAHMPAAAPLKGDLYMSSKRYADAATAYATALKATPSTALAVRSAGALAAAGHQDQAAQQLRDWLGQHPDDAAAAQILASWDIAAHRLDDAVAHLQAVLDKRPNDAIALNNLAWVDQQRGDPQARSLAERAYLLAPGPQMADTLGYILVRQGPNEFGMALLKQASAQMPKDPSITYHLAFALNQSGQREAAVKLLTPLADDAVNFPEKPQARELLAQLAGKP
jgi:putative PEP-CTERM system TPR-repeat lipoprotein